VSKESKWLEICNIMNLEEAIKELEDDSKVLESLINGGHATAFCLIQLAICKIVKEHGIDYVTSNDLDKSTLASYGDDVIAKQRENWRKTHKK
jgi:hypothetical protein